MREKSQVKNFFPQQIKYVLEVSTIYFKHIMFWHVIVDVDLLDNKY